MLATKAMLAVEVIVLLSDSATRRRRNRRQSRWSELGAAEEAADAASSDGGMDPLDCLVDYLVGRVDFAAVAEMGPEALRR